MKKYLVLYRTPLSVLDAWKNTDAAEREVTEKKMQAEWQEWMKSNAANIIETAGAGKTIRVSAGGVEDTRNDVMLYSLVEAESPDAVKAMFANHTHLGIPESTIEIMEANVLPGMQA